MLIHSIIPIEDIFSTNQWNPKEQFKIIEFNKVKIEVRTTGDDIYEIQRIYSTNLSDYLNPEFQPGIRININ